MGSHHSIRMIVGIFGNGASLLLYCVPILTFWRVVKKKSTEEFSCVPYIVALLNCLLYTWYALPVVSNGWENFPVVTINGFGVLLEFSFIFIYVWFSSPKRKAITRSSFVLKTKKVALRLVGVVIVFSCVGMISTFALKSHHLRKLFVGCIGLVASVAMYGSPLVAMLVLYCIYRNKGKEEEEEEEEEEEGCVKEAVANWDMEKNNAKQIPHKNGSQV
ncbi:Bidirectional sugar transporter SWEET3b, partial [Cucurbita argyrosperma subsp. argyrosperma]